MDKKQVEQLLDKIVEGRAEIIRIYDAEMEFCDELELIIAPSIRSDKIHVVLNEDFNMICKVLQIEPSVQSRKCAVYPYEFSFIYKNFEFFSISESEELK